MDSAVSSQQTTWESAATIGFGQVLIDGYLADREPVNRFLEATTISQDESR